MYLLDTDILSWTIAPRPPPALLRRLASVPRRDLLTSSISIGELLFGAYRRSQRSEELIVRIEREFIAHMRVVSFDTAAARAYGRLRASLAQAGTPIGEGDVRIAAVALSRDFTVVTGNVREFARVPGLSVQNWLEEDPR